MNLDRVPHVQEPVSRNVAAEAAHGRPDAPLRLGLALGVIALTVVVGVLVGRDAGNYVVGEGESEAVEFLGGFSGFGSLFIATFTLFLGWAYSGRWMLRPVWDNVRRHRVGVHTWTSIAALGLGLTHTVGLLAREDTRGWASGTASLAMMGALFVTGWWREHYVKSWGLKTWRWVHWELALGSIVLGFEHWALLEHAKEAAIGV